MRQLLFSCVVLALAIPVVAQKPIIFDVSDVVVGEQKIPTLYLIAEGKWSDAGEHVAANSTWITCYKSLGFCDVANANWNGTGASVSTTDFDILRWDSNEIIAVDSSPICLVNTLRVDLVTKRITLSSSDKGVTKGPSAQVCKLFDKVTTAVLWGLEDTVKDEINRAKSKQQNH
jgi:hypothetical protein